MYGKAGEAFQGKRQSVVILSDRSREIIRLFEELQLQRQRQPAEQNHQPGSFSQVHSESP